MAIKYTGSGKVVDADFRFIKLVGKTKAGKAITIRLFNAFSNSNPSWTFAEKDDVVPQIEFEGCYDDDDLFTDDRTEPWEIELADGTDAGNGEIVLGVCKFFVGTSDSDAVYVGLTRGGGSFNVERNYREINADGDPGKVKGRVEQEEGRAKMVLNALQFVTKIPTLYAGMKTKTE